MNEKSLVVVTGASTGIGRATALHLSMLGYSVLAGVRREQDGANLSEVTEGKITPVVLDLSSVSDISDCRVLVDQLAPDQGLKGLVNNAGVNYLQPFELTDPAKARELFEVNFFGLCNLTQALLPSLRRYAQSPNRSTSDTPKIINVGSFGSTMGIPWESYYHASKFAILGLSESIMFELKRQRICVSVLLPGGIRTEFFDKTGDQIERAIQGLDDRARGLYEPGLSAMFKPFRRFKEYATDPGVVAKVIARTLAARRPAFRTFVGWDAKAMYAMVWSLPVRWRHRLFGPIFGA